MSDYYWYNNTLCSSVSGRTEWGLPTVDTPLSTRHKPHWAMLINHTPSVPAASTAAVPAPSVGWSSRSEHCNNYVTRVTSSDFWDDQFYGVKCSSPQYSAIEKAEYEISEKMERLNAARLDFTDNESDDIGYDDDDDDSEIGRETTDGGYSICSSSKSNNIPFIDANQPLKYEKTMLNNSLKQHDHKRNIQRPTSLLIDTSQEKYLDNRPDPASPNRSTLESNGDSNHTGEPDTCRTQHRTFHPPDFSQSLHAQMRANARSLRSDAKRQHRLSCPEGFRPQRSFPTSDTFDGIDVYNLDVGMVELDWETIEQHFERKKQQDRKRRTDRDLIRRRLASETGEPCDQATPTSDDVTEEGRSSLQAKLRTGPNLQICFMNEVASDGEECEEVGSDVVGGSSPDSANLSPAPAGVDNADDAVNTVARSDSADSSSLTEDTNNKTEPVDQLASSSFAEYQLRLREQTRQALASCERAAREQLQLMTAQQLSPTTRVVQTALHKIGVDCPRTRRRVNRSLLSDMNVAQLQIIANDLHTCIEELNGVLMTSLMERDEAVMERDSQLVHIEDLISYYGQKQDHCPRPSSSSSDPAHPPSQTVSGGRKLLQRFSSKTR